MNEPHLTVSGHVAAAPVLRIAGGAPVTSFRIAATPRRYDKATDSWSDAETLWFTVTAWRALAEHCVTSLVKGDKVLVTGRLSQSTWTGDDGTPRTGLEVDAATVGLDLSRSSAVSTRRSPARRDGAAEAGPEADDARQGTGTDGDNAADGAESVGWRSTGEVDERTGEVVVVPAQQPAGV